MKANKQLKRRKPLINISRLYTHLILALITLLGCWLGFALDPSGVIAEPLSFGLGYIALFYLVASLLMGPFYLTRQRRNPVNLFLRRDIGIWAGLTALAHVFFSLQLFEPGQPLLYFVGQAANSIMPRLDLFGLSNDVGLLAAIIIFVLLVLSNDAALRRLKGKRWKRVQQWAYPLIALTIVHTLGYQLYNERDGGFYWALVVLTLVVGTGQGIGIMLYRRNQRVRAIAPRGAPTGAMPTADHTGQIPATVLRPVGSAAMTRRRFLVVGGGAVMAGLATLLSVSALEDALRRDAPGAPTAGPQDAATPGDTPLAQAPPPTVTPAQTQAVPTTAASQPGATAVAPSPTSAVTTAPATTTTAPTSAPTLAPVATATPLSVAQSGPVLTTLSALPVSSAQTFTVPDTGAPGILVHEADGSVKAFSNICTHRPYPLEYDSGSDLLVCPLHLACFNAQNGKVTRGPARRALAEIAVHVDGQGNVIYG